MGTKSNYFWVVPIVIIVTAIYIAKVKYTCNWTSELKGENIKIKEKVYKLVFMQMCIYRKTRNKGGVDNVEVCSIL